MLKIEHFGIVFVVRSREMGKLFIVHEMQPRAKLKAGITALLFFLWRGICWCVGTACSQQGLPGDRDECNRWGAYGRARG